VLVVTRDVANGINRPREEWLMPLETLVPEDGAEDRTEDAAIPDDGETPENPVDLEAAPEGPAEPAAPENDGETTN
jgi:hypothetical protein